MGTIAVSRAALALRAIVATSGLAILFAAFILIVQPPQRGPMPVALSFGLAVIVLLPAGILLLHAGMSAPLRLQWDQKSVRVAGLLPKSVDRVDFTEIALVERSGLRSYEFLRKDGSVCLRTAADYWDPELMRAMAADFGLQIRTT
jgi:hypothetical protein